MSTPPGHVEVAPLESERDLREATSLLERAEQAAGVPLLDEAEQQRLERWRATGQRPQEWTPLLLRRGGEPLAYAAAFLDPAGETATGDVAVARPVRDAQEVTRQALLAVRSAAEPLCASRLQVWMRSVGPAEVEAAQAAGYELERRLAVLGRALPAQDGQDGQGGKDGQDGQGGKDGQEAEDAQRGPGQAALDRLASAGTRIRAFVPDQDDPAVVEVLAAAYAGSDDGGWDLPRLRTRRGWSWFRAEDLLVAQDSDGHLAGIHWLKRRGRGVGEVYNLAVHPRAQGRGVGPALLRAGLDHLAAVGCTEVILWVDTANERAVSLYRSQGFTTRWEDIAVGTPLPPP